MFGKIPWFLTPYIDTSGWIPRRFQPSVHSKTASSTIFYLWVWKLTFFDLENPEILLRWLDMYIKIICFTYTDMYLYMFVSLLSTGIFILLKIKYCIAYITFIFVFYTAEDQARYLELSG